MKKFKFFCRKHKGANTYNMKSENDRFPRLCPGQNVYYIIGLARYGCGLGSLITSYYNHISFALERGYIPVIDLQHYDSLYFKDGRRYKDNAWEYFFKQPAGRTLKQIPANASIVIGPNTHRIGEYYISNSGDIPESGDDNCIPRIATAKKNFRKYIQFSTKCERTLANSCKKTLGDCDISQVLGILCRGTDYTECRPHGEYVQPPVKSVIEHAKHVIKKYNLQKIYLATEDQRVYDAFVDVFGDMMLPNNQYKYTTCDNKILGDIDVERPNHQYNLAMEYLSSLYLLSRCSYFIGGRCNGSLITWLMSDGFKYFAVPKLGTYK